MKLYLHIGVNKTGTTAIQKFLGINSQLIAKQGIYFPPYLRSGLDALWFCPTPPGVEKARVLFHVLDKNDTEDERKRVWDIVEKEIRSLPPSITTTILSHERLSIVCFPAYDIILPNLKKRLDPLFEKIEIIVYLRRQPEFFVSFYNLLTKTQRYSDSFEQYLHDWGDSLYYDRLLEAWEKYFGEGNVRARIYDRESLINGDSVADFASLCGINIDGLTHPGREVNKTYSCETVEFFRLCNKLNPRFLDNGEHNPHFQSINFNFLSQAPDRFCGKVGYALTQNQARQIIECYRESNRIVARRYFSQDEIFSEDYSMYPLDLENPKLDTEKACEIALFLLTSYQKQINQLAEKKKI